MSSKISVRLIWLPVFLLYVSASYAAQSVLFDANYQQQRAQIQDAPLSFLQSNTLLEEDASLLDTLQHHYLRAEALLLEGQYDAAISELNAGIQALSLYEQPDLETFNAIFYEKLADVYLADNRLNQARTAISSAVDNTALPDNEGSLVARLMKRAQIDHLSGASISALQDLQLALQLATTLDLQNDIVEIATSITLIHQQRNEHAIALSYAQRAIETAQKTNNNSALLHILVISMPSLLSSRQLDDAAKRLSQIEALLGNNQQVFYNAKALQFAGELAYNDGDLNTAIEKLGSALALFDSQHPIEVAQINLFLSRAYTELDDMDAAIKYLVEAFNAIPENSEDFNLVQSIHLHRAELLSSLDQFEEAYRVTKNVIAARDINQPIDEIKRMLDMHTNFQLQLQQQENIELKQKNAFQSTEIENKQMLNQLFFLVIGLLLCITFLLLLMFIRSRKHRQKLELIAHTDALTGIYSRRRILEILDFQQDMFNRNLLPYCVAIVDLDFFKRINDTYGHQKGDEILIESAKLAQESFRKTDSVGRIGGEEFLFIFPDTPLGQTKRLLQKYAKRLAAVGKQADIEQPTTASIGLVQPEENEAPSSIISRADKALYAAKHRGRNQIVSEGF
ncbi:diguanylate cyclase [Glaciecola siphonariae]|uniref:diguanylate cyclase n=1 Tax=Glaciecola siphonariae TaxID=521012 RepID=A0ABV9LY83_9ALTE